MKQKSGTGFLHRRILSLSFFALTLIFLGGYYFTDLPLSSLPPSPIVNNLAEFPANLSTEEQAHLEKAIHDAIKEHRKMYPPGEHLAEGHIILGMTQEDRTVTLYSVASGGYFGFENGIFTKINGSGVIPTVMSFEKDAQDNYRLISYKEPMDGAGYASSIKAMFPQQLRDALIHDETASSDLVRQEEAQAREYLQSIGRIAPVQINAVEKQLAFIPVDASNKLFSEYSKDDAFLNNCPYWLGTRESLEDGYRYIYETSQGKTDDGYDQITFRKKQPDHTIVKEKVYKIVGPAPVLVSER
ncbi:hypothetical protein [Heliophilum fasciatum]|uniref:Uncharacterized protein n=1 Tax=Heliophilum fasciatum TaxID=35700 RepID=A0A4R2RAZ2_9FIRM|nr:hypothetical protein [Heliophilum fasciatum]MCW2279272.1 bla regulator protein BlaR1 [Heliophilum fasciatum]TCP60480.1 hypothetical protein EDD73_1368 [Heliophilum fasciatum]